MTSQPAFAVGDDGKGKAERTQDALIEAGIALFSEQGYDATSTRQIEARAGVQRNLMTYHFGGKEEFWKACMVVLHGRMQAVMAPAIDQSQDIDPRERIRFVVRRYVRASAQTPEIARIMFDEGRVQGWRLEWLVEHYVRDFYALIGGLFRQARKSKAVPNIPIETFYYFLTSSGAVFSMSAEFKLLTGKDAFSEAMIDAQAAALVDVLTAPSGWTAND
ncbi:MAG: TetR/AcrR family transcriptional regulator [Pseudomonadota bacterium]